MRASNVRSTRGRKERRGEGKRDGKGEGRMERVNEVGM